MFPEVMDHQCFITMEQQDAIVKQKVIAAIAAKQRVLFVRPDASMIMQDIVEATPKQVEETCFVRHGSEDFPTIGIFIYPPEDLSAETFCAILQHHGMTIVGDYEPFDKDFVVIGKNGQDVSCCHRFFAHWLSHDPLSN
jgi:hypothetical protein